MTDAPAGTGARWPSYGRAFGCCAIALAMVPVLRYALSKVVPPAVGSVLTAALLRVVAEPFERDTPPSVWVGLILAGLILAGLRGRTARSARTSWGGRMRSTSP